MAKWLRWVVVSLGAWVLFRLGAENLVGLSSSVHWNTCFLYCCALYNFFFLRIRRVFWTWPSNTSLPYARQFTVCSTLAPRSLARHRSGWRARGHLLAPHAWLLLPCREHQHQGPGRPARWRIVKIFLRSEDVRAGSVPSNSCTTCTMRHSCYLHYYQDSYTGDRAWQRVHILRTRMEYAMKSW